MTRWLSMTMLVCAAGAFAEVKTLRVPGGGIQPQAAVDGKGIPHLIYFAGEARSGDVFYIRSTDGGATFSSPIRVNSQKGSAIASGTIRGAQLALGAGGRVHVAWNGASGKGMFYTRSAEDGSGFEPQRNVMQHTSGLDGGGSVAADQAGYVYVVWHGKAQGAAEGEAGRAVWVARSSDNGKTFSPESMAWERKTGACGCCGLRAFADSKGSVHILYRSATQQIHRDIYHLVSDDHGKTFRGELVDKWEINACPMSSMAFAQGPGGVLAGWETSGQVSYAAMQSVGRLVPAPGVAKGRKHPALAANARGETLLVWTEGTGWQRGGSLAWQVYDRDGRPTAEKGSLPGIPVWSFGAAFTGADGNFHVMY